MKSSEIPQTRTSVVLCAALLVAFLVAAGCTNAESKSDPVTVTDGPVSATPTKPDEQVLEHFAAFPRLSVDLGEGPTPVAESGIGYHRGKGDSFDDPLTAGHDAISAATRQFLSCDTDSWSMGTQSFTVNAIMQGAMTGNHDLIEKGALGVDWGVAVPINSDGVHMLDRECDSAGPIADYGGSHHTAQWLETLGQAVYGLFLSNDPERYRDRIETYVSRAETIAALQSDDENFDFWKQRWVIEDNGDVFTHKSYMMAAGLGLAASLTDDEAAAERWRDRAAEIARLGLDQQRPDGVNPERGGHEAVYQMYGISLAQLYYATLRDDDPLRSELHEMIDSAIEWSASRIDPDTGQVDITGSTRTCSTDDGKSDYFTADLVRVFLIWAALNESQSERVDQAINVDRGDREFGNPCPG